MQNINRDLLQSSYLFDLPVDKIADRPVAGRHNSKLLVYRTSTGKVEHRTFKDLPKLLDSGHHVVLNNSKVFPCRIFGNKSSGGECEIFLLSLAHTNNVYPVMIKASGKRKVGDTFHCGDLTAVIEKIDNGIWVNFNLSASELLDFLESQGNIPIPPYIRGGISDEKDKDDYQTVYAKNIGSVAAPTAGLHFTSELFDQLQQQGIDKSFVTLHVGAGTFKPVSAEVITDHNMHSEYFTVEQDDLKKINEHKKSIIAVGTTSLRVLESIYSDGEFVFDTNEAGRTDIFLYPGKEVRSIAGLITNFHLPGSSLIMLVSALIGREKTLELYKIAIENDYRFYSYGDAMLILRN